MNDPRAIHPIPTKQHRFALEPIMAELRDRYDGPAFTAHLSLLYAPLLPEERRR